MTFCAVGIVRKKKQAIVDELAKEGVFFEALADEIGKDCDPLICSSYCLGSTAAYPQGTSGTVKSAITLPSMATSPTGAGKPVG